MIKISKLNVAVYLKLSKEETENNEINKELLINSINKIIIFDDGNIKIDYKN